MPHALIIDDNMVVSRAIEDRLSAVGFDSFDHTWTERQALDSAAKRRPDLIVIGDHVAGGSPLEVARELSSVSEAPILAVTTDRFMFRRSIPEGARIDGPYPLNELDTTLASVRVGA